MPDQLTTPDQLPRHLKSISRSEWDKLFALLNELQETTTFGTMQGGEQTADHCIALPYWTRAEVVDRFVEQVHALGLITLFDWPAWTEGWELLQHPEQIDRHLDAVTLCQLITTLIRADRFNDGYLVQRFEQGIVQRILAALQQKVNRNQL